MAHNWVIEIGSASQNVLKLILKSLIFVPFRVNLAEFGGHRDVPGLSRELFSLL